jgi:hypothetical protein
LMRGRTACDGAFLHRFEQRGLRLWSGPVDLVGQHEVGENRTGLKAQCLGPPLIRFHDHAADNVGGHEIGGELNARVPQVEHSRECSEQRRFPESRYTFQQDVSPGEQANQDAIDDILLTDNDFRNFVANLIEPRNGQLQDGFRLHVTILTTGFRQPFDIRSAGE